MSDIKKTLRERASELKVNLPFMDGRENGKLERLIGTPATIRDYGFLVDDKDGKQENYACFIVDEDPQNFYFGGTVLSDDLQQLTVDGYLDEIRKDGLPILLGKHTSKKGREYTTVEYYPDVKKK